MRTGAGNHKLQKSQSLLESGNFCLATSLPVLVGLWLGNALVPNLLEKLGNCGNLDLNTLFVGPHEWEALLHGSRTKQHSDSEVCAYWDAVL